MPPVRITLLPEFTGFNEESANNYYVGKCFSENVSKLLIKPFEKSLKENEGFSLNKLPEEKTETIIELGDYFFNIKSESVNKKPKLKDVYEGVLNYLNFLKEGFDEGIRRKRVIKINDSPFVDLEDILSKIHSLKDEVAGRTLKQTILLNGPTNFSEFLLISKHNLSPAGALAYANGKFLNYELQEKTIKPFENALKEETGYSKDNIPKEKIMESFQIGQHYFTVNMSPEQTVKYAQIFNSLVKETKKITKTTGELVLLRENIPFENSKLYNPTLKKKRVFISVENTIQRINELKEKNTNPSFNTAFTYCPANLVR